MSKGFLWFEFEPKKNLKIKTSSNPHFAFPDFTYPYPTKNTPHLFGGLFYFYPNVKILPAYLCVPNFINYFLLLWFNHGQVKNKQRQNKTKDLEATSIDIEGESKLFALTFSTVAPLIHILHVWDMQKSCLLGNFL